MDQQEMKAAVLAALLDYETIKKTRRLRAVKKTLRGTVMATVIGSTGLLGAQEGRGTQSLKAHAVAALQANKPINKTRVVEQRKHQQLIPGVVHFGVNQHGLLAAHEARLRELAKQLPYGASLHLIGSADALGGYTYNQRLGKRRALSVAKFLKAQGFKITGVTGKVSKQKSAALLARRVDVLITYAENEALVVNMPPLLDQYAYNSGSDQGGAQSGGLVNNNNLASKTVKPAPRSYLPPIAAPSALKPDKPKTDAQIQARAQPLNSAGLTQQKVSGVVHFGVNQFALTSAHKERLSEFAQQLPKDAELIVVGRTDSEGNPVFNKKLGRERALMVANYLSSQGVKVVEIGSKASRQSVEGWEARRADIMIRHSGSDLSINLPPLVDPRPVNELKPVSASAPANLRSEGKVKFIAKKLNPVLNRLNNSQSNLHSTQPGQWWDDKARVGNSTLEKTSWPY